MSNANSAGEGDSNCQPWAFPQVSQSSGAPVNVAATDRRSEKRQEQDAYKAGFARGLADGMASSQSVLNERLACLDQALLFLSKPIDAVDEHVEQELAALAIEIARQIIRREIKVDSGHVVAVVREAIASLPLSSEPMSLHLSPADAACVKEALLLSESGDGCKIIEDPVVASGGCRISSATSQVDATIEKQIAAISARIFGGERDADSH
ncbi:MAG: flagellar assembly protein FliH [Gammaproteobacteria bacterium]|nr:MAG: flagellar assembly protein FliH [Gammaproteobacteria bacterium]